MATTPCRDPGLDPDPRIATVQHRRALSECESKRALAVRGYDEVRAAFGVKVKD